MHDRIFMPGRGRTGVVHQQGVTVKDARSGVVGIIKDFFQKHLKMWNG